MDIIGIIWYFYGWHGGGWVIRNVVWSGEGNEMDERLMVLDVGYGWNVGC